MPKKRTASPSRSPVAKRKRTVKATPTAPKAVAPKATAPKKTTASKATAPKKVTASKTPASKTPSSKTTAATAVLDNGAAGSPLPSGPPRPDRNASGDVGSSVKAKPPGPNQTSSLQPKDDDKLKPPTRMKVSELQMPRREPRMIYSGEEQVCECSACGDEFDPETELETCRYHPGELYVDLKEDWFNSTGLDPRDKYDRLRMDDELYRDEEFPDGFSWSCCGYDRWGKGCEMQSHVPYYY